jgi:hypothetical protein
MSRTPFKLDRACCRTACEDEDCFSKRVAGPAGVELGILHGAEEVFQPSEMVGVELVPENKRRIGPGPAPPLRDGRTPGLAGNGGLAPTLVRGQWAGVPGGGRNGIRAPGDSALYRLRKNHWFCHPEEPQAVLSEAKEGSLQLLDFTTAEILRFAPSKIMPLVTVAFASTLVQEGGLGA